MIELSPSTVYRILRDRLFLFLFKLQNIQASIEGDREKRLEFAEHCLSYPEGYSEHLSKIVFSDECMFWMIGVVNKQNVKISWFFLAPCDFFIWRHLTLMIYFTLVYFTEELKLRIVADIRGIREETLKNVWDNTKIASKVYKKGRWKSYWKLVSLVQSIRVSAVFLCNKIAQNCNYVAKPWWYFSTFFLGHPVQFTNCFASDFSSF